MLKKNYNSDDPELLEISEALFLEKVHPVSTVEKDNPEPMEVENLVDQNFELPEAEVFHHENTQNKETLNQARYKLIVSNNFKI